MSESGEFLDLIVPTLKRREVWTRPASNALVFLTVLLNSVFYSISDRHLVWGTVQKPIRKW